MQRRSVLEMVGTVCLAVVAGCSGDDSDDIQDSDGDGVIDSQDYAPNDPDVQEKSDLVEESPTPTPTPTRTPTPTPSPEPVSSCESASHKELENSLEIVDVNMDLSCLAGNPQVNQYMVTFENTGEMNADEVVYRIQYLDKSGTVFTESSMGFREYPAPGNQAVAEKFSVLGDGWKCDIVEDVYDAIGDGRVGFVITEKKC